MPPIRVAIVEAQTLFAKALEPIRSANGPFSVALRTVAAGDSFVDARVDGGVLRGRSVGAKKTGHAELSAHSKSNITARTQAAVRAIRAGIV